MRNKSFYKSQCKKNHKQIKDAGYEIKEDGTIKGFEYNFTVKNTK